MTDALERPHNARFDRIVAELDAQSFLRVAVPPRLHKANTRASGLSAGPVGRRLLI
jgi:hypothetical protein